jgi:hypothetical protein
MNSPEPVPPLTAPVIAPAAPVWTSNVQLSLAVAFITGVAAVFPKAALVNKFGLTNPATVTGYVNLALTGLSLASMLIASAFRYFSAFAPQVLSWKAAWKHSNTQAVAQTQARMIAAGVPLAVEAKVEIQADKAIAAAATNAVEAADKVLLVKPPESPK